MEDDLIVEMILYATEEWIHDMEDIYSTLTEKNDLYDNE